MIYICIYIQYYISTIQSTPDELWILDKKVSQYQGGIFANKKNRFCQKSPEAVVSIKLLGMCALDIFRRKRAWFVKLLVVLEQLMQFPDEFFVYLFLWWGRKVTLIHATTFKDYRGRLWPGSGNLASHWCQPLPTGIIGIVFIGQRITHLQ